jgi:hypothetical protein
VSGENVREGSMNETASLIGRLGSGGVAEVVGIWLA